jgi:hypothetical protein
MDQTLGRNSRHDVVSTMDAPIPIIQQRIGEGIGDFGQFVALPLQRRDSVRCPPQ